MIGDLLYPDDPALAKEANSDLEELQRLNALHNQLVNVYKELAEHIRTFDGFLMSILVLHYHLIYTAEDLNDLPPADRPKIAGATVKLVETAALDALSIKMAASGIKAISSRIANLYQEGGTFRANTSEGSTELTADEAESLAEDLAPEIDQIAGQTDLLTSANVDLLTNTELSAEELSSFSTELGEAAQGLGDLAEIGEGSSEVLGEVAEVAQAGADVAAESAAAALDAGAAAGEAGAAASGGILLPALIIIIVVTEVLSAVDAAKSHAKLESALKHVRNSLKQSRQSIASVKKAITALMNAGIADFAAYNRLLPKIAKLEGNSIYDRRFDPSALQSVIDQLPAISPDTAASLSGLKAAATDELTKAIDFIRDHAVNDSQMTEVVAMIRTRVAAHGADSVDDAFLQNVASVLDTDIARIRRLDRFRKVLNDIAAALAPFHRQINDGTSDPSKSLKPEFGKMNPEFQPRTGQFKIPKISAR